MTDESPPSDLVAHAAFVRRLAFGLLRDDADADDAAQETIVRAVEHPARGPGVRSWLAAILRNVVRRGRRGDARRERRETVAARPEAVAGTAERAGREEILRVVVDAIASLDAPSREVVMMRHYEDLPPRAIASRLGVPVETVKSRLKRAHDRLRARLDDRRGGNVEGWRSALVVLVGVGAFAGAAGAASAAPGEAGKTGGHAMTASPGVWVGVVAAAALAVGAYWFATRTAPEPSPARDLPPEPVARNGTENPSSPPGLAVASRAAPPVAPPAVAAAKPDEPAPAPPGAPAESVLRLRLSAAGVSLLVGEGRWRDVGPLDDAEPTAEVATLAGLRAALVDAMCEAKRPSPDAALTWRADVEADPSSRWKHVQWILQALADPAVAVHRVRWYLAPGGGASIDQGLPEDVARPTHDGLAEPDRTPTVRIALFRLDADDPAKATTKVKTDRFERLVPGAGPPELRAEAWAALREHLAALHAKDARLVAVIEAPPPRGGLVPYADVYEALATARDAGFADVWFSGAAAPVPRAPAPR